MGTVLDTTVFITLERAVRTLPQRGAMAEAGRTGKPYETRLDPPPADRTSMIFGNLPGHK